jgi:phosphoglycolate phosphatase-like HAD superfamily hydrolase
VFSIHNSRTGTDQEIKLIFWDIDGTLMYCGPDGTKALNKTFYELYGLTDALSKAGVGLSMDAALLSRLLSEYEIDETNLEQIISRYIENLILILDADESKRVLPGVAALLNRTAEQGVVHSLLTSNLRVGAETKLASVDLLTRPDGTPYFTGGGFGDDPDEKWDAALRALNSPEIRAELGGNACGIRPEQVAVIGDSVYDIETAQHCGFLSIAVATGWMPKETLAAADPDVLLDDLTALLR